MHRAVDIRPVSRLLLQTALSSTQGVRPAYLPDHVTVRNRQQCCKAPNAHQAHQIQIPQSESKVSGHGNKRPSSLRGRSLDSPKFQNTASCAGLVLLMSERHNAYWYRPMAFVQCHSPDLAEQSLRPHRSLVQRQSHDEIVSAAWRRVQTLVAKTLPAHFAYHRNETLPVSSTETANLVPKPSPH